MKAQDGTEPKSQLGQQQSSNPSFKAQPVIIPADSKLAKIAERKQRFGTIESNVIVQKAEIGNETDEKRSVLKWIKKASDIDFGLDDFIKKTSEHQPHHAKPFWRKRSYQEGENEDEPVVEEVPLSHDFWKWWELKGSESEGAR